MVLVSQPPPHTPHTHSGVETARREQVGSDRLNGSKEINDSVMRGTGNVDAYTGRQGRKSRRIRRSLLRADKRVKESEKMCEQRAEDLFNQLGRGASCVVTPHHSDLNRWTIRSGHTAGCNGGDASGDRDHQAFLTDHHADQLRRPDETSIRTRTHVRPHTAPAARRSDFDLGTGWGGNNKHPNVSLRNQFESDRNQYGSSKNGYGTDMIRHEFEKGKDGRGGRVLRELATEQQQRKSGGQQHAEPRWGEGVERGRDGAAAVGGALGRGEEDHKRDDKLGGDAPVFYHRHRHVMVQSLRGPIFASYFTPVPYPIDVLVDNNKAPNQDKHQHQWDTPACKQQRPCTACPSNRVSSIASSLGQSSKFQAGSNNQLISGDSAQQRPVFHARVRHVKSTYGVRGPVFQSFRIPIGFPVDVLLGKSETKSGAKAKLHEKKITEKEMLLKTRLELLKRSLPD